MFVFCHFLLFVFFVFFPFFLFRFLFRFVAPITFVFLPLVSFVFFVFPFFLFRFEFFYRFCLTFLFNIVSLSHRTCSGLSLLVR